MTFIFAGWWGWWGWLTGDGFGLLMVFELVFATRGIVCKTKIQIDTYLLLPSGPRAEAKARTLATTSGRSYCKQPDPPAPLVRGSSYVPDRPEFVPSLVFCGEDPIETQVQNSWHNSDWRLVFSTSKALRKCVCMLFFLDPT